MSKGKRIGIYSVIVVALIGVIVGSAWKMSQWVLEGGTTYAGSSLTSKRPTASAPPASASPSKDAGEPSKGPADRDERKRFTVIGDGVAAVVKNNATVIGTSDSEYLWYASADMDMAAATQKAREKKDELGRVVVLAMGTSEPVTEAQLEDFAEVIGPSRYLILVGAGGTGSAKEGLHENNTTLYTFAQSRKMTSFVDWQGDVSKNPRLVTKKVVPTKEGSNNWMALVNWAINDAFAQS